MTNAEVQLAFESPKSRMRLSCMRTNMHDNGHGLTRMDERRGASLELRWERFDLRSMQEWSTTRSCSRGQPLLTILSRCNSMTPHSDAEVDRRSGRR
jgi:hypothetical protein